MQSNEVMEKWDVNDCKNKNSKNFAESEKPRWIIINWYFTNNFQQTSFSLDSVCYFYKTHLKARKHCETTFHEIHFEDLFMNYEILLWNTFTLVFKVYWVRFSSTKKEIAFTE